jgi:hypothetical protein
MTHTVKELEVVLPTLPASKQSFAASLIAQANTRGLSDKQMFWVNKLIEDAAKPAPAAAANIGDLGGINALFDKARQHLKFPAIVMSVPAADMTIRINVAGTSARFPGTLNVTSGEKPEFDNRRTWYGRVMKDGSYVASDKANVAAISERLIAFARDPAGVAAEHGRLTGRCCFCNLHLSDERSTAVGYGKTCASHFGLPWGK